MSEAKIDADVLESVASKLETYRDAIPGLISRARNLDAGWTVSSLGDSEEWATETATDLRARLGIVRQIEQNGGTSFDLGGFDALELAGAEGAVDENLLVLDRVAHLQEQEPGNAEWSRADGESFDDWVERVQAKALALLPGLDEHEQQVADGVHYLNIYGDLLLAGGVTANTAATYVEVAGARYLHRMIPIWEAAGRDIPALPVLKEFAATGRFFRNPVSAPTAVGTVRTMVDTWAQGATGRSYIPFVTRRDGFFWGYGNVVEIPEGGRLPSGGVAPRGGATIEVPRGRTNLWNTGRTSGIKVAARTAGFWRSLGIVGGVAATGLDVVNIASQGNPVDAFREDPAGYGEDLASLAFNASLTAAMVAPGPWTLGAVAVTGVIYGGLLIYNNWDTITETVGEAVDWCGDRLDDLAGGAVDAIADSPVNPANWF